MKSIKEWRKLATVQIIASRPYSEVNKQLNERNAAIKWVENYDKYKLLLQPDVLKRFKRAMKKLKNKPAQTSICLEGDLENVNTQYNGNFCIDNKGKIYDGETDNLRQSWCSEHDGNLEDASYIIDAICGIIEFKEIIKILEKIAN